MKKLTILIAAVALVCFSVPALAVDWNFYGSARIQSWYVSTDLGDSETAAGNDGSDEVRWGNNGGNNSRIGARVKAENVSGRFELQLKGNEDGDPGTFVSTETRLIYGIWDFGAGKLKVGKDYTPVSQFISGQVFDEDLGLLGIGTQYGNRTPGLTFMFGGFEIALLQPKTTAPTATVVTAIDSDDVQSYLPKLEAKWGMSFDAWNFNLMGGYQYFTVETPNPDNDNLEITSYTIGGDVGFNFGPAYVKGSVAYGENWGNAAWALNGAYTDGSIAVWDGGNDVDDTTSWMGALAAGLKVSDMLSFEGGFGYREDDPDANGWDKQKAWSAYVQSVIAMAPGVYVVPEVGYFDFGDHQETGDDAGSEFYLGAKWQIDF